jgi:spermidine synthase
MGTGITAGASLRHPVERVVVTELIPEVIEASRKYFEPYLNGLFEDPRARVVSEDGRNYLLGTKEKFDLIIADLFLPWKAGAGSLYTEEHFEAGLTRLKDGGLFAQWLPLYQISRYEFGIIARTMLGVFPQVTLWRGDFYGSRYTALLVGHKDGKSLDPKALMGRFNERRNPKPGGVASPLSPQAARELFAPHAFPVATPFLPLFYYCGNLTAARSFFADFPLNSDDRPLVEYRAPLLNRKQPEKETPFFVGLELVDFLDGLLHGTPLGQDPFLEGFTGAQQSLVHAGFRLHKARIFKIDAPGGLTDRELDNFRKKVLTENNVRKLFVPISNKEAALKYYLFLMKNLGAAWEDCVTYIMKEDDYHSPELRQWIGNTQVYKEQLENRITRVEAIPQGYLITLIGFNPTFRMEFFERKLEIHVDGTIKELSQKTLIDVSPKHP